MVRADDDRRERDVAVLEPRAVQRIETQLFIALLTATRAQEAQLSAKGEKANDKS